MSPVPCRSLALGQQYSSLGSQPILCGSIPGLVPKQLRFCRNYIEIMPSVAEGVKLGIQECQHQFRGRRWNCTTIDDSLAIFGPVLDKGNPRGWGRAGTAPLGFGYTRTVPLGAPQGKGLMGQCSTLISPVSFVPKFLVCSVTRGNEGKVCSHPRSSGGPGRM